MSGVATRRLLAYRLYRLGLPGIVGLAMIFAAAIYSFAVVLPASEHHAELDRRIAKAATALAAAEQADARREMTPAEQLAAFYRTFPKDTAIPDWLGKIHSIAGEQRLALEIGEYSLTRAKAGRLNQFRITFPVKGSYPQIRKFIAATLATAPALALDSLFLKREKVADGTVDARIVFLLYLEKAD